jgi:hypothetical protein
LEPLHFIDEFFILVACLTISQMIESGTVVKTIKGICRCTLFVGLTDSSLRSSSACTVAGGCAAPLGSPDAVRAHQPRLSELPRGFHLI